MRVGGFQPRIDPFRAAVGAGIATMLLLAALLRVGAKEKTPSNHLLRHPLMTMQDLARRMRRDEARRSSRRRFYVGSTS